MKQIQETIAARRLALVIDYLLFAIYDFLAWIGVNSWLDWPDVFSGSMILYWRWEK